jgi:AcrR family transcriptional regulator
MSGRGFSDGERDRIEADLVETGRELFARYGLSKTTIQDLTEPVGIAPSTFYRFFDSKEALYLRVLKAEGEAVADRVVPALEADDPREGLVEFLSRLAEEIETNPLIRSLVVEDDLDRLRESLSEVEARQNRETSVAFIRPAIERWQAEGALPDEDPELLAHVVRSASFVTLHEEDVGDRYPEVRDRLFEAVAEGLAGGALPDGERADGTTPDEATPD